MTAARNNKVEETLVLSAMFVSLDEPFTEVTGLSELTGLVGLTKLVLVLECFAQVSANTLSSGAFCQN